MKASNSVFDTLFAAFLKKNIKNKL
jgi:hypothetical protein